MESLKMCTLCQKSFPATESFFKGYFRRGKRLLEARCKNCLKEYNKTYRAEHPEIFRQQQRRYVRTPKGVYNKLCRDAKTHGREVKIPLEIFVEWYQSQPRECYYCGIKEEDLHKVKDAYNNKVYRLTIDRTDSSKNYEMGNIVLCCLRCNHIKGDFFTQSEMEQIGKMFISRKWKNVL